MTKKQIIGAIALVLAGMLFGIILVSGLNAVKPTGAIDVPVIGSQDKPTNTKFDILSTQNAFVQVAKEVVPTVVSIKVVTKSESQSRPFDFFHFFGPDFEFKIPEPSPQEGMGSGVIITKDGYILTNNHVVEGGEKGSITVTLWDGREFKAKLIGRDKLTDLAVLKIDANDLPVARFGNSDELQVGQWVLAVGNPLGLNLTVTAGIVSALSRNIGIIRESYGVENFIQTDAAINPGNSGGPLVNLNGEVVGINTAIASRTGYYQGYGFAIPINLARKVAEDIIKYGKVRRGVLGVQISKLDEATAKGLGLDKPKGIIVQDVISGSAAEEAGVKAGDVILECDGKEVNTPGELQEIIARKRPGDKVNLKIYRDGKTFELTATLKPRKEDEEVAKAEDNEPPAKEIEPGVVSFDKLGITVANLDEEARNKYKVKNGVIITKVDAFSEAYDKDIRENDIIIEADRKPVRNVDDLKKIVQSHKSGDVILLRIKARDGNNRYVGLRIP
ncbi:DegQ family serine endoprotease [Candidatus Chrysopegis kryptomonas]|uniref:Serine protease Do n=1 Tax=Candidatus Chryseopegocella kryptomonas TaxID=1633643 RepID=A0A0N7MVV0_9BACT|nr:DegQ family serine endoprotease [Candidatus Chrysopegis kryptomonas]CUS96859.1 serine protease Do [Candidatus Chrysopegis kryptomonas]